MTTRTITLTMTVTDAEANALVTRFLNTSNAAPEAPVPTQPTAPVADGDLDVRGLPHNPEFHADTRSKNQDGTWKSRRGHDKDALLAWEKEQLGDQLGSVVAPQPEVTDPGFPIPAFLQKTDAPAAVPTMPAAPAMPTAPAPLPVPTPAPTYEEMLNAFGAMQSRTGAAATQEQLIWVYAQAGVTDVGTLSDNGEQRRKVVEALNKL